MMHNPVDLKQDTPTLHSYTVACVLFLLAGHKWGIPVGAAMNQLLATF